MYIVILKNWITLSLNLKEKEPAWMSAARTAHLHELVVATNEGWSREVGARGGQLSGGQKQRVAIARAIVKVSIFIVSMCTTNVYFNLQQKNTPIQISFGSKTLSKCYPKPPLYWFQINKVIHIENKSEKLGLIGSRR